VVGLAGAYYDLRWNLTVDCFLQRQALALGEDASSLPPEVVLGVRVAETKATRAA
jgi:hypothetical protein